MTSLHIGGRTVGAGVPCFVIAEAGVNHNGDAARAHALVDAAAGTGADAVKFQTFSADTLATRSAPKAAYQRAATGSGESQYDMLKRLELAPELHAALASHCREAGVIFLSTPFDEASADLLEGLDMAAFKVPSGEITNLPLLRHLAAKGRPLILSTGMATLADVDRAVDTVRGAGADAFALLHCVSDYPADPADVNLRAMLTLRERFDVPAGYSDHTLGLEVPLAAVALGACIIEKHFTLDRALPGPDHGASITPADLAALVRGIRVVEAALGDGRKAPTARERETAAVVRRSLAAARIIPAGTVLTADLVVARRPGTGLPPEMLPEILGRRVTSDVDAGTLIRLDMLG